MRLPTELASSRREKKPAPWADNTYLLYTTPLLFVVPPIAPITEGQCDFYGNACAHRQPHCVPVLEVHVVNLHLVQVMVVLHVLVLD